jgi:hypothetical protein
LNRRFSQIIASSACWRRATQQASAEHEALWPLKRITVLVDESRVVEASIIIEQIGLHHPGLCG